jgi:predicted transcriptional regulator
MLKIEKYQEPTDDFTIIPIFLLKSDVFDVYQKIIIQAILQYKNLPTINLSNNFLSKELKLDIRTVQKAINQLITMGVITKEPILNNDKKTNEYLIVLHYSKMMNFCNADCSELESEKVERQAEDIKTSPTPLKIEINDIASNKSNKADLRCLK